MSRSRRVSRLIGFAALPMFGVVTPLLALPAITQTNGIDGWTAIAVGQSVGAGGAVLVELGWALTGPQAVAAATLPERRQLFAQATASKILVLGIVGPVVVAIAGILATHHAVAVMLSAFAIALSGLSPNWYFIGEGNPRSIFLTDTIPRVTLTLAGVGLLYTDLPLWTFALSSVIGYLLSFLFGARMISLPERWAEQFRPSSIRATLRTQRVAVTGRSLSALYIGLPTSLVQAAAPASVGVFSAAERLVRMGLLVLQSVPNVLQRYLGTPTSAGEKARRVRVVVVSQVVIGVVAGLIVALLLPLAADLLLTGTVEVSTSIAVLAGGVALVTCASRGTGLALVSSKNISWITASAAVGALLGISLIPLLAATEGATGAMAGLLAAEAGVLAVQVGRLLRNRRVPRS